MNKKRKKINYNDIKKNISNIVVENSEKLWCPPLIENIIFDKVKTNSWFDIKMHTNQKTHINVIPTNIINEYNDEYYKAIKVKLLLNEEQKYIINNWLDAYTFMYNETIKYIRNTYAASKIYPTNFFRVREILKNIKNAILNSSFFPRKNKHPNIEKNLNTNKNKIKVHILDQAIKQACSSVQGMIKNKMNGNTKSFRLRFLKYNRKNKIMKIEKIYFRNNTICGKILGKINARKDGEIFNLGDVVNVYNSDCTLKYDTQVGKYFLFVSQIVNREQNNNLKEFISIDPGCRKFLTGISENEIILIGTYACNKIEKKFKRLKNLEKIKNEYVRKQKIRKCREKIENMIDDFHWKTIKYIIENYRNVMIGNMSTKSILSKKVNSQFSETYKKSVQQLSYSKFRERLKDKCEKKNINYKMINEYCTTKICSMCGFVKENVKNSEIYNCDSCKRSQDRDINSSRNIYFKRLL